MSDRDIRITRCDVHEVKSHPKKADKGMRPSERALFPATSPPKGAGGLDPKEGENSKPALQNLIARKKFFYRDIFQYLPDPIFLTGSDGKIIACNYSLIEMTQFSQGELISRDFSEVAKGDLLREKVRECLKFGTGLKNQLVAVEKKDGGEIRTSVDVTRMAVGGERVYQFRFEDPDKNGGLEKDRKTHRLLETVFENTHMHVAHVDKELVYLKVNGPFARFHKMPPEDIRGKKCSEIARCPDHVEICRRVLSTGESHFAPAQAFEPKPPERGEVTYWDCSFVPVRDEKGEISGLILMFRDVTQKLRAENALIKSQEELFQAQKMEALGVLIAGIAHEINNPINQLIFNIPLFQGIWQDIVPILAGYSQRHPNARFHGLTYEFIEENMGQLLSNMDMAANRIARIVEDLKNFSRRSSVNDKEKLHLNTAVKNALRLAQATIKKSGVELVTEFEDRLPLIEGNLHNVEQIVLNLLINAIQAMEDRRGEVRIRTCFEDGKIVFSVSDTGKGISPQFADRIFDPFVTSRQGKGGTGLGLSVTYNLVKAHGGEIAFQTQENVGTTFTVSFPYIEKIGHVT